MKMTVWFCKRVLGYFCLVLLLLSSCSKGDGRLVEDPKLPDPPKSIIIEPGSSTLLAKWDIVANATSYNVELSEGTSFVTAIKSSGIIPENQFEFKDLDPDKAYVVRVRAIDTRGSVALYSPWLSLAGRTKAIVSNDALAFPGAEGFGKFTTGGRGGRVIKVTNLNDSGPGSLREALNQTGARIIVFEISGNIKLQSRLVIRQGDVTVAGQTAPGDGICIQDYEVFVDADNVVLRFLRFRLGDLTSQETDAIWGRYHKNIVLDHCSISWSIDECASFYANSNFTMQWCILSESLNKSVHEKDDHGYGGIWGGNKASFYYNLLAHHNSRNPRFDGGNRPGTGGLSPVGKDLVDFRYNVLYNWKSNSIYGGENGEYNIVNNYFKYGPATPDNRKNRIVEVYKESNSIYAPGHGRFYITGNYVFGNSAISQNNWNGGVSFASGTNQQLVQAAMPFEHLAFAQAVSAEQAFDKVLSMAGASLKRDAVDIRVIGEVKEGKVTYNGSKTGFAGIIDSQKDVGSWPVLSSTAVLVDSDGDGMPDAWERSVGLDPAKANANSKDLSPVYDNIEVYINSLVAHLY